MRDWTPKRTPYNKLCKHGGEHSMCWDTFGLKWDVCLKCHHTLYRRTDKEERALIKKAQSERYDVTWASNNRKIETAS